MSPNGKSASFLHDQLLQAGHKIARLRSALETCNECLEAQTLRTALANAELERSLLHDLLNQQTNDQAVSLEALILQQIACLQRAAQRANRWQAGQRTPPAYWEAEVKRAFLSTLLSHYHSYHPPQSSDIPEEQQPATATDQGDTTQYNNGLHHNGQRHNGQRHNGQRTDNAYPWYSTPNGFTPGTAGSHTLPDGLDQQIRDMLDHYHIPHNHLTIIVQPHDPLIVTGYVHTTEDYERIVSELVKLVPELLTDIKIVEADHCPACHST